MKEPGVPDSLTVINGPEDGAEFSLLRAPLAVGQDPSCVVQIRLDRLVQPIHAQVSTVPDGYRVRCSTGSPAFVNGRRVGRAKSRVIRNGDVLKIGHTELILDCAPDGLASRSRGIATDGDAVWLAKNAVTGVAGGILGAVHWLGGAAPPMLRSRKFVIVAAAAGLLMFWPEARYWAIAIVRIVVEDARSLF